MKGYFNSYSFIYIYFFEKVAGLAGYFAVIIIYCSHESLLFLFSYNRHLFY